MPSKIEVRFCSSSELSSPDCFLSAGFNKLIPVKLLTSIFVFLLGLNLPTLPFTLLNSPLINSSSSAESLLSVILEEINFSFKSDM